MTPGVAALLVATTAAAPLAPPRAVTTLAQIGPALTACYRAPDRSTGSQVTVLLSLTRSGAVLGRPRITFSKLVGRAEDQRAFVQTVLAALSACTPVAVTPGLGAAIAGRPISIRFIGGEPAPSI